jgi:hypothetical protein
MMEVEQKQCNRLETAEFFSNVSRGAGKVSFKITYTNTEGNRAIDQKFQDFCFKQSNNEYLAGIALLLSYYDRLVDRTAMENYLKLLELRIIDLEDRVFKETNNQEKLLKEDKKVIKTF